MIRLLIFALVLTTLGSFPATAEGTKLTEKQIRALISDKTIYWRSRRGNQGTWFYDQDGKWSGRCCAPDFDLEIGGTWKIENNQVCQYWGRGTGSQIGQEYCMFLIKEGDTYYLRTKRAIKRDRKGVEITKIADGNPDGV